MKKKLRLKKKFIIIILAISLCLLIYSIYNIILWKLNISRNEKIRKDIEDNTIVINNDKDEIDVDFAKLKEKNPDTIAYIKVNNTRISYVVVKGSDNSFYLDHNFNKEYNIAGWVFADYKNKFDDTDKNIVLYAHNTNDGSMFGTLKDTLTKTWQENKINRDILLITEKGKNIYRVFSTYTIKAEDYYIKTDIQDSDFSEFVETLKKRSNYDYKEDLTDTNAILTLSSCVPGGVDRVVLHARLVD